MNTELRQRWGRMRTFLARHRAGLLRHGVRVTVLLVVIAVALGYLLLASPWTRLEAVEVHVVDPHAPSTGAALTDDSVPQRRAEIVRVAAAPIGEPLVEVDTREITRQVAGLDRYSRVSVTRDWPATLSISVTPRTPVLAATGAGSGLWLVDAEGLAYEPTPAPPPGVVRAALADEPTAAAQSAVAAVLALPPARRAQIQEVRVSADAVVTLVFDAVSVRWGVAGQEQLKAAVALALMDKPDVRLIDVSVPGLPVTTG